MKPDRPLKSAVAALALIALLYSIFTLLFALIWRYGVNITGVLAGVFIVLAALPGVFAAVNFIRYRKMAEREVFSCRLLLWFLPALLIYVGFELYNGYLANTADVLREKLNTSCFKQLDETKLCEQLLSGEDPENEIYHKTDASKLLDGKIPKFRGIYTGDLATSFGTGGEVYMRLGRAAMAEMKVAAMKRDSAAYLDAIARFAKVMARASAVPNDPLRSGATLMNEFISSLESDISMSFPNDEAMKKIASMLFETHENFEARIMNHALNVIQGTFTRFDALKDSPEKISRLLNPVTGKPAWSSAEVFAGKLFPAARRNRLIRDYEVCVRFLGNQRAAAVSVVSNLSLRLEQLKKNYARGCELNVPVTLALYTDISALMISAANAQTRIENALIAVEVENYRRRKQRMPEKLDDIKNGMLQEIPTCHADGSAWQLEVGRISVPTSNSIPAIPGVIGGILKQPGFRVWSGIYSFSILNR